MVSESDVRCDDLNIVRSLGRGIKSDFGGDGDGDGDVVVEGS